MAYADSLDRAGDSGSRVGVSAKAVIEKFGSISADNRNFVAVAGERSSTKSERVRRKQGNASSDRLTSLEQTSVVTRGLGLKIAPSPPSRSMEHRSRSETTVRQLLPSERALVDAVLLHRSDTPRRSGGLDWTLGLLGFASRSLRALRRRRREKLLLEGREATGSAPTAPAKPTLLQREQERLAITKTAVLARDVQTVAGMEARDRALADVEMRASYAVWKDAELRKHLAGIETERAEAYDAYRLETRRQLQRAWDVEKVFRNVLRLMGVQGAEIRRAMSEAYQERRSAIQRSCKAIWAVAGKIKPSVMDYVDWLDEQSGTIADRARLHLQASARSQASNNSSAAPPDPAPAYAARIVEATHTIDTVSIGKVAPASAEHEASRFSAIFARSDAEALRDMGQRDAAREIEPAESIHAERAVAVERAISKAAKKILGAASFSHLDDVIQTAPGPERTAAFMAIRDEIFSAGAHRRARRGVEVPVVSNTGKVRRAEAWRDR